MEQLLLSGLALLFLGLSQWTDFSHEKQTSSTHRETKFLWIWVVSVTICFISKLWECHIQKMFRSFFFSSRARASKSLASSLLSSSFCRRHSLKAAVSQGRERLTGKEITELQTTSRHTANIPWLNSKLPEGHLRKAAHIAGATRAAPEFIQGMKQNFYDMVSGHPSPSQILAQLLVGSCPKRAQSNN